VTSRDVSLFLLGCILLSGCSTRSESIRKPGFEECLMFTSVDCNERNADVIVIGEVVIREDGAARLLRITDIKPPGDPLSAKAIAAAEHPMQYDPRRSPETVVETFPFCEHPFVDVIVSERCPMREGLEQQMRMQGYRLRSVKKTR
jgi:hypothetical protein